MKEQHTTIILCRHGETEWTLSGQHTGSTDLPLTQHGKEQAHDLGQRLKNIPFQAVYASPLLRARTTCELANLSKQTILEPDAVEWNYGDYEALTSQEIEEKHPLWNVFLDGAPRGESPADVTIRADRLIRKFLTHPGTIALFSHGHFLRLLAARWIDLDASAGRLFSLSVASISILGFEKKQRTIKLWNGHATPTQTPLDRTP
jgi:probable phosphoglycerate mutase